MSARYKALYFLALTFALSWAVAIGGWVAGLHEQGLAVPVLAAMMTGPAIAAVVFALAFEPKGERLKALGLSWTPNIWWLIAWLGVLLLALLSVIFTVVLTGREFVDVGAAAREIVVAQGREATARTPAWATSTPFIIVMADLVGAAINSVILTFTEELGWRGYLHHLWRPFGFWRASLATGAVWGVWHTPAILLFGLNYPENREIGVLIFIVFCMLISPLMTLVRDRGGSVIAAGIAHGTLNAMGGLTVAFISNPAFPWAGIVGIGGFLALALAVGALAFTQRRPPAV